jgi:SAM-dependent methyltransferase
MMQRGAVTRLMDHVRARKDPFWWFEYPPARALNDARMSHLASLDLPLEGGSVLEVGAGIGLLTGFFEERGCTVMSTDARPENIAELRRRHPERRARVLDLEDAAQVAAVGSFDVVFCYGTLYHLGTPAESLEALGQVAPLILLETCLTPGDQMAVNLVAEHTALNQAQSMQGCRPTRPWVMDQLRRHWGHAYASLTAPAHPDFPTDWPACPGVVDPVHHTRAVFVGSRSELDLPGLSPELPERLERRS